MLPTAATLIRAAVVCRFGIATTRLPVFGTLAARTIGKLCPPSVDSEIRTFAALTGELVVFATFQVTLNAESGAIVMPAFGAVTANGPDPPSTVTVDIAVLMPPPPARLSRATTLNVIVRPIAGSSSPTRKPSMSEAGGTLPLFRMYCSDGK
jgi:hypothetical protein